MTAAKHVTRFDVEAALARLDATNHDDANLLRAVIQQLENEVKRLREKAANGEK
jgi:hypothetical protein